MLGGAAYMLFGVFVTFTLAWACAIWAQRPVLAATRVSVGSAVWPIPVDPAWPDGPSAVFDGRSFGYAISGAHALRRRIPDRRLIETHRLEIHDLGWPLPALRWHRRVGPEGRSEDRAIPLPRALERTAPSDRRLPWRPRWGAIVDTLVFALFAWLAVGGPMAVQRAARAWRGSCPACGYDLRTSAGRGCPECGSGRRGATRKIGRSPGGRDRG